MFYKYSCRFSFSVSYLLLALINLNFYLQYNAVEAATISNFQSNNEGEINRVCQNKCTTQACRDYENELAKYMNTAVDPCDDFYEFACGNLKNSFPSVPITTMGLMTEASGAELLIELNEGIKEKDSSAIRKLKTYYNNCMDKNSIEEGGDELLLNILNKIGGWPVLLGDKWIESDYDLMNTIHKIMQENLTMFFPIQIDVGQTHYKRKILTIDAPSTVINHWFFPESVPNEERLEAYYNLMVNVATSLGANESIARKELLDVLIFEKDLYDLKLQQNGEFVNANLIKKLPPTKFNISWFDMIVGEVGAHMDFSETDKVYFKHTNYFEYLQGLLNDTPKKVVANYVAWHFIKSSLRYQPKYLEQLDLDFIKNVIGLTILPQYLCLNEIMTNLQHGVSALFVRMNYNSFINKDVANLFQNIKEQFKINLEKLDWMDEKTRLSASRKVDAMTVELPYPDRLAGEEVDEYYKDLEINSGSYFESFLNVSIFGRKKKFEGLYEEYNISSWIAVKSSVDANGYYQYYFNQMMLPAGFLRSPLYHPERPQYLNYGGAGSTIGHEITHGFDSTGRYYDENGNMHDWWQPETQNKFLEKVECLIHQYNDFILAQTGQSVDGNRTKNENIADNGGIKMAYYAYQTWVKRNNASEDCLSSVNYTPAQLFWITSAKNWCTAQSHESAYNSMLTDDHSPSQARIINAFSNIKEFADDFQCEPGSRMNPEKRCILW